jgi:hypothetical protein
MAVFAVPLTKGIGNGNGDGDDGGMDLGFGNLTLGLSADSDFSGWVDISSALGGLSH